jgi:hypothetical protein
MSTEPRAVDPCPRIYRIVHRSKFSKFSISLVDLGILKYNILVFIMVFMYWVLFRYKNSNI